MKHYVLFCFLLVSGNILAQKAPFENLNEAYKVPKMKWLDSISPIRSLLFRNENVEGHPTEVFAFYATPGTLSGDASKDKNLPAVVLLHGGGGTAFPEWVLKWAKRGYAAIAIDQSGNRPITPEFNSDTKQMLPYNSRNRKRLENGGPPADSISKFIKSGGDLSDDWQNHTVFAAIRAHSLLRSFPEVDARRTAITGISWGGYMTCLVASMDHRFKAAVPVYGCGFLYEGESVQKPIIDRLPRDTYEFWVNNYDPSTWLPKCTTPMLFVNGTNDIHYPLDSYMKTYNQVKAEKQLHIKVNMKHGHKSGWTPKEIGAFIDYHLLETPPLPKVEIPVLSNGIARAEFKSETAIKYGQLHYTTDVGPLNERQWKTISANIEELCLIAKIPIETKIWMFTLTDERGLMVSSEVQFIED